MLLAPNPRKIVAKPLWKFNTEVAPNPQMLERLDRWTDVLTGRTL